MSAQTLQTKLALALCRIQNPQFFGSAWRDHKDAFHADAATLITLGYGLVSTPENRAEEEAAQDERLGLLLRAATTLERERAARVVESIKATSPDEQQLLGRVAEAVRATPLLSEQATLTVQQYGSATPTRKARMNQPDTVNADLPPVNTSTTMPDGTVIPAFAYDDGRSVIALGHIDSSTFLGYAEILLTLHGAEEEDLSDLNERDIIRRHTLLRPERDGSLTIMWNVEGTWERVIETTPGAVAVTLIEM